MQRATATEVDVSSTSPLGAPRRAPGRNPITIAVFGASGGIGGHLVRQALHAGHTVTAVVRDGARFDVTHSALRVERVPGLTEPDVLAPLLEASDAVVSAVGPRGRKDGDVAASTTRGILRAMELAGVRRFVAVSAVPVGPVPEGESFLNRGVLLPLIGAFARDVYVDLSEMEDEIRRSATEWTIVRPPKLVNKPLTGTYRTVVGGNVRRGYSISRSDVADLMLHALNDPTMIGQAVGIAY